MSILTPIHDYIDSLVHPSVRQNRLLALRHRAFIAPRIMGALGALAALPVYLALWGVPGPVEGIVFAWLVAPILIAYYLAKTGKFENAHLFSCIALGGLISFIALKTGGIGSFAAMWLILVPLEATLSGSRRIIVLAALVAIVAMGALLLLGASDIVTPPAAEPNRTALTALGLVSAMLYAAGIALSSDSFSRALWLRQRSDEARYDLLARHMTDLITRHGEGGNVLFASPAAARLVGCEPAALIGHGLFDRVHVADRPAYLHALSEAGQGREERSADFRLRREVAVPGQSPSSQFVWVEMRCRALVPAHGRGADRSREVVAVIRDVSERKDQEREVEAAHAEVERANAAKGRFLAVMSHELRTPLNIIIGFSEMLMDEQLMRASKSTSAEYARLIHDSGAHLLSVVNLVLDMSKLESGSFQIVTESFSPAPVIESCGDLLALKAREAGIELCVHVDRAMPEIVADKRALKQILLNLLSNAIKFTKPGGRVDVTATSDESRFILRVEDTGVGIPTDDIKRVGDPFFQVRGSYDRPSDGTGLGLSIVKGLVALHGGQVSMTSQLGKGTIVTIEMPRECQAPAEPVPLRSAPASAGTVPMEVRRSA